MSAAENTFSVEGLYDLGYTNRLGMFNRNSIEGQTLPIVLRWQESEFCYLILQEPGEPDASDYCLDWILSIAGINYAVLRFPPPIREDEPVPSKIVLQILDRNTLRGITEADLLAIAATVVQETRNGQKTEYSTIDQIIGPFPTWEESKDTISTLLNKGKLSL